MQRRSSDFLRQAYKIAAARAELRSEHADAAAVADLVDLVEEIDDVETHRERLGDAVATMFQVATTDSILKWNWSNSRVSYSTPRGKCF